MKFNIKITFMCLLFMSTQANSALIVDINDAGAGNIRLDFSGSDIVGSGSDAFHESQGLFDNDSWGGPGIVDYTTLNFTTLNVLAGSTASVTTVAGTRNIDQVLIDDDLGVTADEFGIGVDGTGDLAFSAGELVSWSGFALLSTPFSNLIPGTYSYSTFDFNIVSGFDLTVNIGTSSVPTPETVWLFGTGLIGLIGMRKKSEKLSDNYA